MLTLNPARRITAQQALDHEYFKSAPLPCPPSGLPKIEVDTHEYQVMNQLRFEQARFHAQKGPAPKKCVVPPANGPMQKRPLPEQPSEAMEPPTHAKPEGLMGGEISHNEH